MSKDKRLAALDAAIEDLKARITLLELERSHYVFFYDVNSETLSAHRIIDDQEETE